MSEPSISTSITLLGRLRDPNDQADRQRAWGEFFELYQPLFLVWARRHGFQDADFEDLLQNFRLKIMVGVPRYVQTKNAQFRGWLWRVLDNTAKDFRRRHNRTVPPIGAGADAAYPSEEAEWDEAEYRQYVVRRALEIVSREFAEQAVAAFTQHIVHGRPAAEVAAELGIPVGTVYSTCNRVLTRLRVTIAGLTD